LAFLRCLTLHGSVKHVYAKNKNDVCILQRRKQLLLVCE